MTANNMSELTPENGAAAELKTSPARWKLYLFGVCWLVATLYAGYLLLTRSLPMEFQDIFPIMGALVACAVAFMLLIGNPIRNEALAAPAQPQERRPARESPALSRPRTSWFIFFILAAGALMFALRTLVGPPLLFALPVLALLTLVLLRQPLPRKELLYASGLAVIAALAGYSIGGINWSTPALWSGLQIVLTLPCLLAGWGILRRTGLAEMGVGRLRLLQAGPLSAGRGFLLGILLAVPWALANVVLGSANADTWVKTWWQPFTALQPGIAEEAWGHVFLVPFLFLLFRLFARPRAAFVAALFVVGYWFAYLHTPGGLSAVFSTLAIGTLYSLPISYLCLFKDLETAIGFHFWVDFIRFGAALVLLKL